MKVKQRIQTTFTDKYGNKHNVYLIIDKKGEVLDADIHQCIYENGYCIYCGKIQYGSILYKEIYGCD